MHIFFLRSLDYRPEAADLFIVFLFAVCPLIFPAKVNPFFAMITAIISLITAAAAMVPFTITARDDWPPPSKEAQTIPVNTSDTPEWGKRVNPRYFWTVSGIFIHFAPNRAPKYFPHARTAI